MLRVIVRLLGLGALAGLQLGQLRAGMHGRDVPATGKETALLRRLAAGRRRELGEVGLLEAGIAVGPTVPGVLRGSLALAETERQLLFVLLHARGHEGERRLLPVVLH